MTFVALKQPVTELQPRIKVVGDRLYRFAEDFWIEWIVSGGVHHRIKIKEGFVCDGNSVPALGRVVIPGDWTLGIIPVGFHDWGYYREGRFLPGEHEVLVDGVWVDALWTVDGKRITWRRREIDRLWASFMREYGVNRFRRRMSYRFVRAAVWKSWDESEWTP